MAFSEKVGELYVELNAKGGNVENALNTTNRQMQSLVATQGKYGAALAAGRNHLEKVQRILQDIGGLAPMSFGAAAGMMERMAAAASPEVWSTFTGSWRLLAAVIGRSFTPILIEASRWIQRAAHYLQDLGPEGRSTIAWVGGVTLAVLAFGTGLSIAVNWVHRLIVALQALRAAQALVGLGGLGGAAAGAGGAGAGAAGAGAAGGGAVVGGSALAGVVLALATGGLASRAWADQVRGQTSFLGLLGHGLSSAALPGLPTGTAHLPFAAGWNFLMGQLGMNEFGAGQLRAGGSERRLAEEVQRQRQGNRGSDQLLTDFHFQSSIFGIEDQWRRMQVSAASISPLEQQIMRINQEQWGELLQAVGNQGRRMDVAGGMGQ